MNIYEKMSAISMDLQKVGKDLNVAGKYRAVSEGNILAAVKPLEAKHGIYSYPFTRNVVTDQILNDEKNRSNLLFRIETVYRFVNIEKPEETIDITSYGTGLDQGDKEVGKAMTYADKYALMKAYKIETGDDPDKDESVSRAYKPRARAPMAGINEDIYEDKNAPKATLEQKVRIATNVAMRTKIAERYGKDYLETKMTYAEAEACCRKLQKLDDARQRLAAAAVNEKIKSMTVKDEEDPANKKEDDWDKEHADLPF